MTRHLSREARHRFAVTNKSIESCAELLSREDVRVATNGLAEASLKLLELLYVPNQREGVFRLSESKPRDDGIPFIVADMSHSISFSRHRADTIHPLQFEGILNAINEVEGTDLTEDSKQFGKIIKWLGQTATDEHGKVVKVSEDPKTFSALVYKLESGLLLKDNVGSGRSHKYNIETSPVVFGDINEMKDDEGALLFHETIHLQQTLKGVVYRRSVSQKRRLQRDELEAYHGGAVAEEKFHNVTAEDNPRNWNTLAIEAIRRRFNKDKSDPFEVSTELLAAIRADKRTLL